MKGPSIVAYAVRSVVRNRRASASALVGLVLGVAVVTAPWIALDSSLQRVLDQHLEEIPVDAVAFGSEPTVEQAAAALAAVPNVQRTEPLVWTFLPVNASQSGLSADSPTAFPVSLVLPSFDSVAGRLGISGGVTPPPGRATIPRVLHADGLDVGERIVFEIRIPLYDGNGTQTGEDVRTSTFTVSGYYDLAPSEDWAATGVFLSYADAGRLRSDLNVSSLQGEVYAWLDRKALLDPLDAAGSAARLNRQRILMDNAVAGLGFTMLEGGLLGYGFTNALASMEGGTLFIRLFFLMFAIPALAIAWLLSKVGFEVGLTARRRELGVLRARGMSVRGVRLFLLAESAVLAVLAGILGLALAVGLSRLIALPAIGLSPGSVGGVAISSGTAIFALLLAMGLAVGTSRRVAKLLASQDLVAAFKSHQAAEASIPYKASRDFLLAGVGTTGILLVLAWGSVKGSPVSVVTFLFGLSTAILAPLAPFFLTVAGIRYLTRGTTRPYQVIARLFRRYLGELHPLVAKNLARAPRRASSTAMIATFAVGFAVAVSVFAASAQAYQSQWTLRHTPADVIAELGGFAPEPGLFGDANRTAVASLPGVAAVTRAMVAYTDRGIVIVFDAATYVRTVPWVQAQHLGGVDPAGLMAALRRGSVFAANTAFTGPSAGPGAGLQVGDSLRIGGVLGANSTARLVAVVPEIPGLYEYDVDQVQPLAYVDLETLGGADVSLAQGGRYLIALGPGANVSAVAAGVQTILGNRVSIRTLEEAVRSQAAEPLTTATFAYLQTQTEIAIGLMAVAVGLLVTSASVERRDELVTLIARGAGTRAATRLLMAEGWVVSILGLLLGVLGGLVVAATFLGLVSSLLPVPIPYVVPPVILLPLFVTVLGIWAASYVGAVAVQRMDVPRVLKLRGG